MSPSRVLILDTETTGLDPAVDEVVEVAVALFDVKRAAVTESWSCLIRAAANPAEKINGIAPALLADAPARETVWARVVEYAVLADAVVAHNAEFDRAFSPPSLRTSLPWICSKNDLEWPRANKLGESLVSLALAHGLGVAHAHRAMADVDTLARLLSRAAELGVDLGAFLARGLRPKAKVIAQVSYDDREKAKASGFQWDGATKKWWRIMALEDAAKLPFPTRQELLS